MMPVEVKAKADVKRPGGNRSPGPIRSSVWLIQGKIFHVASPERPSFVDSMWNSDE